MARYMVQMTFETPNQHKPVRVTRRLPGHTSSMQCLGGDGMLAVSAANVLAESPADAAMIVMQAVNRQWTKSRGPLKMVSWRAHRKRVLLGGRGRNGPASGWWDQGDGGDEGGSAGVREPRRPLPGPGSLHAAADLPGPHQS
jgi:hypothetical protein